MCKKLMFLISFVALLGLVNIVSANDWEGDVDRDWCNPDNWDGGVPGPDDGATLKVTANDPLVEGPACGADFGLLSWDLGSSDAITLDIVNAEFRMKENEESGDGLMTVNVSGTSNVDCWDDRWRWGNDGHGVWNQSDDSIVHIEKDFRGGDGGDGAFDLTMSGGVLDVGGEFLIGDDGGGVATFTGGDVVLGKTNMASRPGGVVSAMVVSNTEIYVNENFKFGKGCDGGGGETSLTMTSGTINAEDISLSDDSCVDVNVFMEGGLLIARRHLKVGNGDGAVAISLTGGEIRVEGSSTLSVDDNGTIDITEGVLKIKGNVTAEIAAMVCDGSGRLTGYGGPPGVVIAFDGEYTVVTATTEFDADKTYCPIPADGAERVTSTAVELCWTEGACIGSRGRNIIFFGPASECEAVCNDTQGGPYNIGVNRAGEACYLVGDLPLWECFCWRVDTFCEAGNTVKGDCWTFCTGCEDIPGDVNRDCLVNFEDYACVAGDFGLDDFWPLD